MLAHFLDRMLSARPARVSDAPAWFESAAALMRRELHQLTRGSPQVRSKFALRLTGYPTRPVSCKYGHTMKGVNWSSCHAHLQDTLTPLHQYMEAVLGPGHPVSAELRQLAAANESPAVRQARMEKQRVMEVSVQRTCAVLLSVP